MDKEIEEILNRLRVKMRDQAIDLGWVQEKIIAELRQELYAYRDSIRASAQSGEFVDLLKRNLNRK